MSFFFFNRLSIFRFLTLVKHIDGRKSGIDYFRKYFFRKLTGVYPVYFLKIR